MAGIFPNGLMPAIRNNSNALLQGGLGLLSGPTAQQQAALGAAGFAGARQQAQQKNATLAYLQKVNPQLAQMYEQGMLDNKALGQYILQAQQPKDPFSTIGKLQADLKAGRITQDQYNQAAAGIGKPGVSVNVNNGNPYPGLSKLGEGYTYQYNEDGSLKTDANGNPIAAPIPGGPKDTSVQDANRAEAKANSANLVLDEIDIAKQIVQSSPGTTTGLVGGALSTIDSTTAGSLKNRLRTIKANIGFDKLQAMRDASPTGGALGQVSEFENRLLQSVYGSLEQSQKASDILYNLQRLEDVYNRIINEGIPADEARQMYRQEVLRNSGVKSEPNAGDVPEGVDPGIWEYMTPEERALWQN